VGSSSAPYLAGFSDVLCFVCPAVVGTWMALCDWDMRIIFGILVSPFAKPLGTLGGAFSMTFGTVVKTGTLGDVGASSAAVASSRALGAVHDEASADARLDCASVTGARDCLRGGMTGSDVDGGGAGGICSTGTRMVTFRSGIKVAGMVSGAG
jgi:hypothetical protein